MIASLALLFLSIFPPPSPVAAGAGYSVASVALSGAIAREPARLVLYDDFSRIRLPLEAAGPVQAALEMAVGRRVAIRGSLLPDGVLRVAEVRLIAERLRR